MSNDPICKSWLTVLGVLASALLLPLGGRAAEIDLSTYQLQPNQANQTISIYVSGGDAVTGVNFNIETGDGGPDLGGSVAAPQITAVDLMASGAVFENNNTNAFSQGVGNPTSSQFWEAHVETSSGTLNLGMGGQPQLLATVTFDTTGFAGGTFALILDDPRQATTFSYGVGNTMFPTVVDGFLQIGIGAAPEPTSIGLLGLGMGGMLLRRRRRLPVASAPV